MKKGRNNSLLSEIDLIILEKLSKEKEVFKTKFKPNIKGYQHIRNRLNYLRKIGLIDFSNARKGKVTIVNDNEENIKIILKIFSSK